MRIDLNPTDTYAGFKIRPGLFLANGSHIVPGGVNFTLYSLGAANCELLLFKSHEKEPFAVIPFPENYRIGCVFAMIVFDLDYENIEYGFRVDGEYDFKRGLVFDKSKILLDPYAKLVTGRDVWGVEPDSFDPFQYRSKVVQDDFDWEGDLPLKNEQKKLVTAADAVYKYRKKAAEQAAPEPADDVDIPF